MHALLLCIFCDEQCLPLGYEIVAFHASGTIFIFANAWRGSICHGDFILAEAVTVVVVARIVLGRVLEEVGFNLDSRVVVLEYWNRLDSVCALGVTSFAS